MKYAVLASGSKGNSTVIQGEKATILIDCGLSKKRLLERLDQCGIGLTDITHVLVTHAHSDHTSGLGIFPIEKLYAQLFVLGKDCLEQNILAPFSSYDFNGMKVTPLALSHDSINTTGYIIEENGEKLVYMTDTGYVPDQTLDLAKDADYYIFESNHDTKMLCESSRPAELIKRILGDHGHLSNIESAYYLSEMMTKKTKEVILAHLSEECNTKDIALDTYKKVMLAQRGDVPEALIRCADETNVYKGGNWKKIPV